MSNSAPTGNPTGSPPRSLLFCASITLAVILSVIGCTFFLLIPTQSINVDTVYEGF